MKKFLILSILCLMACQSRSDELEKFTDFNNYQEDNTFRIEVHIHDDSDCGEWGGHRERITVYKTKDLAWRLLYKRYPTECDPNFLKNQNPLSSLQTEFNLNLQKDDLAMFKGFALKLKHYVPRKHLSSNAPDFYTIEFKDGHITKSFKVYDQSNDFEEYRTLRTYLIERRKKEH